MKTIRASEIGLFLYCQRAWWYQKQGWVSENQTELNSGSELHRQHGRRVAKAGLFQALALAFLLVAILLLTVYLTARFV